MTVWSDGRLCAFDTETTAPDPEHARIVSATVALVGGGLEPEMFSVLVDPGVEIPAEATAVHGITTERARTDGMPPQVAIAAIVAALDSAIDAGYPIVAMNARYDLTLSDRECRRHGLALPDWSRIRVVDPFVVDKHLDRFRRGSRKLDALCAHYGAKLDEAHEAAADAVAAARVAWCIAKRGQVNRRVRNGDEGRELAALRRDWERLRDDLDQLHVAQIGWAAEQARGLAEYFARQGKSEHVAPEWPLIPYEAAIAA